ncbi:MAG: DUF3343 domain-containing protein [Tissierellia bacterium]|nr:DUF3343 domain-containing protein [Tissierellia bacterium]
MKEVKFGVITFKSTHYAIQADSTFKNEKISYRTIPTPREISRSCGLAIKFNLEDYDSIRYIIEKKGLNIEGVYMITKNNEGSKAERLQ